MKAIAMCGLLLAVFLSAAQASDPVQTFDLSAVKTWAGSGSNEAVFIIDWHDGNSPTSLAWGYKWDGTASVYDMLQAVDVLDTKLLITAHPIYSDSVYSIYYDLTGNGGTPTIGRPGDLGGTENGSAPDSGDHYKEGWFTGFWGLLNGSGNPYNGGSWLLSNEGASSDQLTNNGYYAFSFTTDTTNYIVPAAGVPVAALVVPEPSLGSLIALGAGGCAVWRLRRRTSRRVLSL